MTRTLWKCPVPLTTLVREPSLKVLPRRQYEIAFCVETEGHEREIRLSLVGVAAFKCTHLPLLTAQMVNASYGKAVDLGETPWLAEGQRMADKWSKGREKMTLSHIQTCFDDGPCYEFLCEGFSADMT